MNDAGVLCKQITGKVGFFTKCTKIREHSRLMSKRMKGSCSCSDVNARPRFVSHTINTLSSLPDTAVVPSADTLTHVTWAKCPAKVWISSPVWISHTMRLLSFEPDMTWFLLFTDTATQVTASLWPANTWASLPPVACHTLSDMSREPVITKSESTVMAKQVISSACETVYFSSSRVSDQILRLESPLVQTWEQFNVFFVIDELLKNIYMFLHLVSSTEQYMKFDKLYNYILF